jgi:hypothetical protein
MDTWFAAFWFQNRGWLVMDRVRGRRVTGRLVDWKAAEADHEQLSLATRVNI